MKDDRFEQLEALYNDGDPDVRELAGNEIVTLGEPLEVTVPYLLEMPVPVHPVQVRSKKALNALRSLKRFIKKTNAITK